MTVLIYENGLESLLKLHQREGFDNERDGKVGADKGIGKRFERMELLKSLSQGET
jgi:hypothetical protein